MSNSPINSISFRDRITTINDNGRRKWLRPKQPKGNYYNLRTYLSLFYFAIFILVPFIQINGRPLFLLNIPERKFILFSYLFGPQDMIIFGLTMVTSVIFIATFTVAFGRIFCGWVCPQTIFMEMLFRKLEYFIEGNPKQQQELKNSEWNFNKVIRKGGKHLAFWLLSFIIANTFLAWIISVDKLYQIITEPVSQHFVGFAAIVAFTTVFYTVFTFVREQACTIVCPYGRLQGVLIDSDSVVVSYDYKRGEPRGIQKKNEVEIKGDCIDCKECVKVCPTGIDIRNGTQLECINCTACIDACNAVMIHMKKPTGLVRYATNNNILNKKSFTYTWRMKGFTVALSILLIVIFSLIITRKDIDSTIMRAGGTTYTINSNGSISNLYKIKIANKTFRKADLKIRVKDIPARINIAGTKGLNVDEETTLDANFFVELDKQKLHPRKNDITFEILNNGKVIETIKSSFFAP